MSRDTQHTDVGAYALGLLEDTDRRVFEAHLAHCRSCATELADFSGMRDLFSGLPPLEPERPAEPRELSAAGDVVDLLRRRKAVDRHRRRGTVLFGAAAGVVLLAGGVTFGVALADQRTTVQPPGHDHGGLAQDLLGTGERRSATDPRTHVAGTVAMESKGWGTHVALDLSNLRGSLVCQLVAVTRAGRRHVVTEWAVPPKGYGVPGSPAHLTVHGGTASPRADITRFEVRVEGAGRLLTIPV